MSQNIKEDFEIIVACPDDETAKIIRELMKSNKHLKLIKEEKREGKPAAINKILAKAKGQILIFTDADVIIGKDSINKLLLHFKDKNIGLVTGHLVPTNDPNSKYGFWAKFLYDKAHEIRLRNPFFASGNLMAIRNVIKSIPTNALSDDFVIAKEIEKQGFKAVYEKDALVYVNFPTNIKDFVNQRRRTFAGHIQLNKWYGKTERNLGNELKYLLSMFNYCRNFIQYFWMIELAFWRLLSWILSFYDIKIKKKSLVELWKPIESSK